MLSLGVWVVMTLIPLSVVPSKKQGYYLLPLNPALALLCGMAVDLFLKTEYKKKAVRWILALTAAGYMLFSLTPIKLHKYKILKRQDYYKQFYDMDWLIRALVSENSKIYYSPGLQFILNFKFSEAFQKNLFQPLENLPSRRLKKRIYLILNKQTHPDIKGFYLVSQTRDLWILSNSSER